MKRIQSITIPRALDDNPYQSLLVEHLQTFDVQVDRPDLGAYFFLPFVFSKWKPDVVHFHWLHPLCLATRRSMALRRTVIFIAQLLVLKLLGIKIVWTVHNLKNHENQHLDLDRFCTTVVARIADAILAHCEAARQDVITMFALKNTDKVFAVPHGNYVNYYENKIDRVEARKSLDLDDANLAFLFLGAIRPYKGVLELLDAFKHLQHDNIRLVIAGKVSHSDQATTELFEQKIADDKRVKFIPGFVADDQIQHYMNACDVVIFPYRDVLTSGSVLLAMSFDRACIAPQKGCIGEVLDRAGSFLYDIDGVDGLRHSMQSAIQKQSALLEMGQHNRQLAEAYSWTRVAEMTVNIYRWCLNRSERVKTPSFVNHQTPVDGESC